MTSEIHVGRRFGGVSRLYGEAGLVRLQTAHIVVIGLGGVGSWTVEALARNALGKLTLIDLDNVSESNFNRQLHAIDGNEGKSKVTVMRERVLSINPECKVIEIDDFITPDNLSQLLNTDSNVIIDCTDDAKAKTALANYCKQQQISLFISGSAGGRLDPTRMQLADLANVQGDKLLAKVRNNLRREFQFPKASNTKKSAKFGLTCVYSNEPVIRPNAICDSANNDALTGLNCAGYGSSVTVTACFGFALAQAAINSLLG